MDQLIEQQLQHLPRLGSASREIRKCKVCGGEAELFDAVDFNKWCSDKPYDFGLSGIRVNYFRCEYCQFLFTDFIDDWSANEIARYIYNDDYILVDPGYQDARPLEQANAMAHLLDGGQNLRILDYGSGSGKFAKNMKDRGFSSVVSYDPFSSPARPEGLFDLVTAFEVVEHSPRPLETFKEMRDFTAPNGALLVGQTVQPANIDEIKGGWWYLAPRNGHVSTYSDFTFFVIAKNVGLFYRRAYKLGGNFAFTRSTLSPGLEQALTRIGPKCTFTILDAPVSSVDSSDQWHKFEQWRASIHFRWTAKDQVNWDNIILEDGLNRIELPFIMEITDEFARGCRLQVDGQELPTIAHPKRLIAEVHLTARGAHTVSLRTPPLPSPLELRRSEDARRLGLAVPTTRTIS